MGSDSMVISIVVPAGPPPKNSGRVEVTTSCSSILSRVTVFADGVAISFATLKPDEGVDCCGTVISALGRLPSSAGGRLLKS